MNPELQTFARQLALWTELIIEHGRTPFRRVDLFPKIHTDQGPLHPPLVFWINRQSMMAGGILLLPEQNLDSQLQQGKSCCNALGLKHFVTWESDQVRIWQLNEDHVDLYQRFELDNAEHPDAFRHLLANILEVLKLLAVIGLVPNAELSAHYLHNLFQTTLDLALPALINDYRSQRAEAHSEPTEEADLLAEEANRMLLLQLLGLAWYKLLPDAILPEKIERAIQLSLPALQEPLRSNLTTTALSTGPELPHEAAVCFHHLLLRLRQLDWRQDETRALSSLKLLIANWGKEPENEADILIYPYGPIIPTQANLVLADSPSLLAACSFYDVLHQQPDRQLQLGNLFQLDLAKRSDMVVSGQLLRHRQLSRLERQQYSTLLRTSWPNRRFRISSDKPLWYWELLHLLGLSRQQQILKLILPTEIFDAPPEDPFWSLCLENFSIQKLALLKNNQVELSLKPGHHDNHSIDIRLGEEIRHCEIHTDLERFRNQLLLTLMLPTDIFQLLTDKLSWPDQKPLDENEKKGQLLYLKSELGLSIGRILEIDPVAAKEEERQLLLKNFPQPDPLLLKELAYLCTSKTPQQQEIDQLLTGILQLPSMPSMKLPEQKKQEASTSLSAPDKNLKEELIQQVQKIGIPNFPEQYLYFLDQPVTSTYSFTAPLQVKSELLGEFVLEDSAGSCLQVYGEELANALLLCSALGKEDVELPSDRCQLAMLQKQYGNDLKQLHKQLNSLCHSRLQSSKAADKLTKKIWKQLNLPKPGLIYQLRH